MGWTLDFHIHLGWAKTTESGPPSEEKTPAIGFTGPLDVDEYEIEGNNIERRSTDERQDHHATFSAQVSKLWLDLCALFGRGQ